MTAAWAERRGGPWHGLAGGRTAGPAPGWDSTERMDRPKRPMSMTSASGAGKRIGDEASQCGGPAAARKQEEIAVEAHLLARARAGDPDAFVQLIGRHDRALRALA